LIITKNCFCSARKYYHWPVTQVTFANYEKITFSNDLSTSHQFVYIVSQKNIPDIFDCNLKTNYQILIIFGMNIPDTTCHQMTTQLSTSPNVCFCTT